MSDDQQEGSDEQAERKRQFQEIVGSPAGQHLINQVSALQKRLDALSQPLGLTRVDSAKVVQVVQVLGIRGDETPANPTRQAVQYWTLGGELIVALDAPVKPAAGV